MRWISTSDGQDVFVAVADGLDSQDCAVALNAFHERISVVDIIASILNERHQITEGLIEARAAERVRAPGMDVEDRLNQRRPGPARRAHCKGARLHRAARHQVARAASTDARAVATVAWASDRE